jgi:Resolvase, N terminal domain
MNPKISVDHLKRRAIVYIRQSSPGQVIHNQESQRRQYGLADHARQLGFQQVEIIDEDLGRSGSGQVERPGFQHLVAEVCTGEVGAVLCIEASRLARNGRDWHHLIELCGLVRAIVIDPDGVYDPGILNDRLLLGLNRPETQNTPCSTSRRPLRTVFQLGSRSQLARRQSIPPADVSHVLRSERPTKGAAEARAIQAGRDLVVAVPWRHFVNLRNRFVGSL